MWHGPLDALSVLGPESVEVPCERHVMNCAALVEPEPAELTLNPKPLNPEP